MRENLCVVPHCCLDEVAHAVPRYLESARWQLGKVTHLRGNDAIAAVTRELLDLPGAHAFVAHDVLPADGYEPMTVLRIVTNTPTPLDPLLPRALSEATGGWACGMLADRMRLEFGVVVFYAGHTLEAELDGVDDERYGWHPRGPRLDEERTRETWARLLLWIARAHANELSADADRAVRCWFARPPSEPPFDLDALVSPLQVRAVFADVTADHVRAALAAHAPMATPVIVERATTVLQTPYVIADGVVAEPAFVEVARALGGASVRLELGAGSGAFTWTEVIAGSVRGGRGQGALALATTLGAVAQPLGEPVSVLR